MANEACAKCGREMGMLDCHYCKPEAPARELAIKIDKIERILKGETK